MYSIVSMMGNTDQKIRIEDLVVAFNQVFRKQWVHVMDSNLRMDLSVENS